MDRFPLPRPWLAAHRSPANPQRTYHTAILTHPDERCAWAAVAVNVATPDSSTASGLSFDVIEVLRNNEFARARGRAKGSAETRDDLPY
jgi:hypothetical protein